MPGFLVHRLSRDLDLDASQRERVESIARRTQEEMREARRQLRPRIEEIIEKGRGEIRAGLRPDQQARFDEIVAERRHRRERWRGGGESPEVITGDRIPGA